MSRHTFRPALFLAGLMATTAAFAGTDIVKCVDPSGHVTLTDEPCRNGADTVILRAGAATPPMAEDEAAAVPAMTRVISTERAHAAARPVRHDAWVKKATPERILARDVATLKAARANMQSMDRSAASARPTRLAGLN